MALSDEELDSLGFTFVWKIENFSHCLEQKNCCIESPDFVPAFSGLDWNMKIYPKGEAHNNAVSYKVNRSRDRGMSGNYIAFILAILGSDGSLTNFKELEGTFRLPSVGGTLIEKEELFGEKKDIYLPRDTLTLHLRLCNNLPSWLGQTFARTRIGVLKSSITWKIPQFSDTKTSAENKIFEIKQNFKENITLNLYLKNSFKCSEMFYLEISETNIGRDNSISIEIAVIDLSGSRTQLCTGEHRFEKGEKNKIWNFPISILRSTLLTNKSLYLPDDTLTLQCDLALSVGVVYSELEFVEVGPGKEKPYVNSSIPEIHRPHSNTKNVAELPESLSTDLLNFYTEGDHSDFELGSGSSKFPAHKFILMARSPVFRKMLSSDMIEKNTNMVEIPDLDSDTVKRMLHFMYTDAIEVAEWGAISKLYFAADKYRIESLKKKCSAVLERNICASNFYEALELGDLHQGQDLKNAAMTFVFRNDHEILTSEEWMQFNKRNVSLAAEVMHWMYLKKIGKK